MGIKSGASPVEVIHWLAQSDRRGPEVAWAKRFAHQLQAQSWLEVLEIFRERTTSFAERMLLDLLIQISKSSRQAASNFKTLSTLLREIESLKAKTRSLMMVPQLQALSAALLAISYSLLLPFLFPEFFPSFLHLNLVWEFVMGEAILALGLGITLLLSNHPRRYEKQLVQPCFFFNILAYRLESGEDLDRAWDRALDSVSFPKKWMQTLRRSDLRAETFESFIDRVGKNLSGVWSDLAMQLQWALRQSSQIAPYLREIASYETQRVAWVWELESKRLSVFILLPLLLLCFPASVYLILGPQFLMVWR